jgi:hypothetical protein
MLTLAQRQVAALVYSGNQCDYRQVFLPPTGAGSLLGPLPNASRRPTTTQRDTAFDPTEGAVLDSTVDAGTGYVGGYAPAIPVSAIFSTLTQDAIAEWAPYGIQLNQNNLQALVLTEQILVPARGDLIIHPDGTRYVVAAQQAMIGLADEPFAYRLLVERRVSTDPVYTV